MGRGSGSKTSRPAPATWPVPRAAWRATRSMTGPRAVFTMMTPGLVSASASSEMRWCVQFGQRAVQGQEVTLFQERLQVGAGNYAVPGHFFRRHERVVGVHLEAHRQGPSGGGAADAAIADDTEGPAVEHQGHVLLGSAAPAALADVFAEARRSRATASSNMMAWSATESVRKSGRWRPRSRWRWRPGYRRCRHPRRSGRQGRTSSLSRARAA